MRVLVLAGLVAFAGEPGPPPPAPEPAVIIEEIEETTVGDLGGERVPMGNVTRGRYTLPDGTEREGAICSLVLPGGAPGVFVGAGSVVEVAGHRWEVLEVESPPTGLGNVRLKRLD